MNKCLVEIRFGTTKDGDEIELYSIPRQVPDFLGERLRKTRIERRANRSTIVIEPVPVPKSAYNQIYKQLGLSMPFGEPHEQMKITKIIPDD